MTRCFLTDAGSEKRDCECDLQDLIQAAMADRHLSLRVDLGVVELLAVKRIVLDFASAVLSLSPLQLRAIEALENESGGAVSALTQKLVSKAVRYSAGQMRRQVESSRKRAVVGPMFVDDGQNPVAPPIESWAGPVAGQTFLETRFRIPRSTLHLWQRRGDVVALRKGARRHVFPLAQFVDGRPVAGLRDVLNCFSSARRAWLWLVSPASELQGGIPIEMLKEDLVSDVVAAARAFSADFSK